MSDFNKQDVLTVAKAVVENCLEWDEGYTNAMNAQDGYICNWCHHGLKPETKKSEEFKHSLDCPVLVAQDLLTPPAKENNS